MATFTLSLHNPNTLLPHRAGIAGSAIALDALDHATAPIHWSITDDAVTLGWEDSISDRDALTWLMSQTYQIRDGCIHMPALRLDRQGRHIVTQGLLCTLLQHSKQRSLASESQLLHFPLEDDKPEAAIDFRPVLGCYYTGNFKDAFNSKEQFKSAITIKGHHLPGLVECFVNGAYQESPENFLALLFMPLACSYYKLPRQRSALVIPEISNLTAWLRRRKQLTAISYKHFQASGAGEAGLRFLLWAQVDEDLYRSGLDYCEVYQLGKQQWDGNQSYLKQKVYRIYPQETMMRLYSKAEILFGSRVREIQDKDGKMKSWLTTSEVLAWMTDNLIDNRPWHCGFFEFHKTHPLYPNDRKGLVTMAQTELTDRDRVIFEAVQGAFSTFLHGQIKQANAQHRSFEYGQAYKKVFYRLKRPSTQQQFATALVEFLSGNPSNAARGKGLAIAAQLHSQSDWKQVRDLALLAIATYQGKSKEEQELIDHEAEISAV
ncbi:MAG: type I-MYXAN CRISPR-associated Cas8a1/Cmx1 [Cyanobacteria bacterium]|nr:type I-MYXAN CRISPR-associated Cas8a1/Cmx1 [Cyanobacteriota bacterium]